MTADVVHQVTAALVDAELAFWFSPYHTPAPHSVAWILEFDGGDEVWLFLEDDDAEVAISTFVPQTALSPGQDAKGLEDGVWLSRVTGSRVAASAWVPLEDLDELRERVYGLLAVARRAASKKKPGKKKPGKKKPGKKKPGKKKAGKKKPGKKKAGKKKTARR